MQFERNTSLANGQSLLQFLMAGAKLFETEGPRQGMGKVQTKNFQMSCTIFKIAIFHSVIGSSIPAPLAKIYMTVATAFLLHRGMPMINLAHGRVDAC